MQNDANIKLSQQSPFDLMNPPVIMEDSSYVDTSVAESDDEQELTQTHLRVKDFFKYGGITYPGMVEEGEGDDAVEGDDAEDVDDAADDAA